MDQLAKKLNITSPAEWTKVTHAQIQQNGGSGLMTYYRNSLPRGNQNFMVKLTIVALKHIYPNEKWEDITFDKTIWTNIDNQRAFMDNLAQKLNIKSFTDWYSVTTGQLQQHGAHGILFRYGGSRLKGRDH
jgi:hypothetical protein